MRCGLLLELLLWALGHVTAPHAHPQHAYERTAQRAPVASIGTLRMTVHTHAARHAAAAASSIWHEAVGVPFSVLSVRYSVFVAVQYSKFLEIYFQFKTDTIVWSYRNIFSNPILFWVGE